LAVKSKQSIRAGIANKKRLNEDRERKLQAREIELAELKQKLPTQIKESRGYDNLRWALIIGGIFCLLIAPLTNGVSMVLGALLLFSLFVISGYADSDQRKKDEKSGSAKLKNRIERKSEDIAHILSMIKNTQSEIDQANIQLGNWDELKAEDREAVLAKRREQKRLAELRTEQGAEKYIRSLSPQGFERLIADLLKFEGWDAKLTKSGADQGVDIEATKRGTYLVVQCKLYAKGNMIGSPAIRDLAGAQARFPQTRAIFATTSSYSKPAILEAKSHRYLRLWNMDSIKMRFIRHMDQLENLPSGLKRG
tara:strand:+ start:153 stop:1079 length:927 start_codon:yes stop_codon:yes gene_type:complete